MIDDSSLAGVAPQEVERSNQQERDKVVDPVLILKHRAFLHNDLILNSKC